MRPETKVWMLCESVGRPADKLKMQGTTRECIYALMNWLLGVYMGSKIRITFARDEAELESKRDLANSDIAEHLESILNEAEQSNDSVHS